MSIWGSVGLIVGALFVGIGLDDPMWGIFTLLVAKFLMQSYYSSKLVDCVKQEKQSESEKKQ
jgi:hypothetical protein